MARPFKWLGIAIFGFGAAVAALAVWYWLHVRPVAGEIVDELACPALGSDAAIVVRGEQGGNRSFVELHRGGELTWQAMIPHYAGSRGRHAIACSQKAITARFERDGRAEVFAFLPSDGQKLGGFRLATEHQPIHTQPTGPITLADADRSYEFVGGADWHQLIAVDLASGQGAWKVDLGANPVVAAEVEGDTIWVEQSHQRRGFQARSGVLIPAQPAIPTN